MKLTRPGARDAVVRLESCRLRLGSGTWPYAERHRAAIDDHWRRRSAENPAFFNGRVHVLEAYAVEGAMLEGRLVATDFKSFLHWRETGAGDCAVLDAFGSALIRSSEGHVILGRQRPGHVNSGLAYPPGGFIDGRDVGPGGEIDIVASVLREVEEETGLGGRDLARVPGFIATFAGNVLSLAVELRSAEPAARLATRIQGHLAADPAGELDEVLVVGPTDDLDKLAMPRYARALLESLRHGPGSPMP